MTEYCFQKLLSDFFNTIGLETGRSTMLLAPTPATAEVIKY